MNEVSSAQTSKELFRTPLACALLSGALAVAVREGFRLAAPRNTTINVLELFCCAAAQLHGPVLCRRDRSTVQRTFTMTMILFVVSYAAMLGRHLATANSADFKTYFRNFVIYGEVTALIQSAILGAMLAVLYRRKQTALKCAALAMLSMLPVLILSVVMFNWYTTPSLSSAGPSVEYFAFSTMLSYLTTLAKVVLPTIAIDRALRDDASKQAVEHE